MPLQSEHITKAERNEKLAETLFRTSYIEWAVTVLFYAAVHYVDAILAASGLHPDSHGQREDAINANPTLMTVRPQYRILDTLSRNARYYTVKIEPSDLLQAQNNFQILRTHLRKRLGLPD